MKLYAIGFTRNAVSVIERLAEGLKEKGGFKGFASPRIYEQIEPERRRGLQSAELREFTRLAWQEADAILFVSAAGIAVRAISPYVYKKDVDPAVLVIDEQAQFVIPVLSGHIGGGNQLAQQLSELLEAQSVITTATDISGKLAIDTWAMKMGMRIVDTAGIVHISAAVLENRDVLLFAPEELCQVLRAQYPHFDCHPIEYEGVYEAQHARIVRIQQQKQLPAVVISPRDFALVGEVLHIVPQIYYAGMGARADADRGEVVQFFVETLAQERIHPLSIRGLYSIDIKKGEPALAAVAQLLSRGEPDIAFYSADELLQAERYTDHVFAESSLVQRVTGVGTVCERAAVIGAAANQMELGTAPDMLNVQLRLTKQKGGGATLAIARCSRDVRASIRCIKWKPSCSASAQ